MSKCLSSVDCNGLAEYCDDAIHRCRKCAPICAKSNSVDCQYYCKGYKNQINAGYIKQSQALSTTTFQESVTENDSETTLALPYILLISLVALVLICLITVVVFVCTRKGTRRKHTGDTSQEVIPVINLDGDKNRGGEFAENCLEELVSLRDKPLEPDGLRDIPGNLERSGNDHTDHNHPDLVEPLVRESTTPVNESLCYQENSGMPHVGADVIDKKPQGKEVQPVSVNIGQAKKVTGKQVEGERGTDETVEKSKAPTAEERKTIYNYLRRADWCDGYFSAGESIEVYIDPDNVSKSWVNRQLKTKTGQTSNLFHIKDAKEEIFAH